MTHPGTGSPRIAALDVVRGFALCGILLVNLRPIAGLAPDDGPRDPVWLGVLTQQRFYVIFALLFGVGFALLADAAGARLVLVRRLLVLLGIGLVHRFLLWGGDILTVYAVVGLVVLVPSTWLPRRVVTGLAVVVTVAGLALGGGGPVLIAGLFLSGAALVRHGVVARLERSVAGVALVGAVCAAAAVPAVWWQLAADDVWETRARGVAGLLMAVVYVSVLLVLLHTPLRRVLVAVFAPLGRMALTNYLGATVAVLGVLAVLRYPERWSTTVVLTLAGLILGAQWVLSALWLRRFRQGPLEWLWRWATWGSRPAVVSSR